MKFFIFLFATKNDVHRMNDSGNKAKASEQNVDQQVTATTFHHQDTQGWENDGQNHSTTVC